MILNLFGEKMKIILVITLIITLTNCSQIRKWKLNSLISDLENSKNGTVTFSDIQIIQTNYSV